MYANIRDFYFNRKLLKISRTNIGIYFIDSEEEKNG